MNKKILIAIVLLIFITMLSYSSYGAVYYFVTYDSVIKINSDGSYDVKETITYTNIVPKILDRAIDKLPAASIDKIELYNNSLINYNLTITEEKFLIEWETDSNFTAPYESEERERTYNLKYRVNNNFIRENGNLHYIFNIHPSDQPGYVALLPAKLTLILPKEVNDENTIIKSNRGRFVYETRHYLEGNITKYDNYSSYTIELGGGGRGGTTQLGSTYLELIFLEDLLNKDIPKSDSVVNLKQYQNQNLIIFIIIIICILVLVLFFRGYKKRGKK